MLKITIANEEVLCSNDFTINKEMLNTPSVILNNVYPKSWELNKDYTTNFYYPNDYEQCSISDDTYYPYEKGITVEGTSFTLTDVDTTKESELMSVKGQTTQNGTPTPTTPVPINVVSGRQDVVVAGKNIFSLNTFSGAFNTTTYTNMGNILEVKNRYGSVSRTLDISSNDYKQTNTNAYDITQVWNFKNLKPSTQYTVSCKVSTNMTSGYINLFGSQKTYNVGTVSQTFTTDVNGEKEYNLMFYGSAGNGNYVELTEIQLEKGSTATSYEAYKGNTYEINLGKNLFYPSLITTSTTSHDITFTNNEDGTITLNGTANGDFWFNYDKTNYDSTIGNVFSVNDTTKSVSGTNYTLSARITNGSLERVGYDNNNKYTTCKILNGTTFNNAILYIQIEKGTQATTYAPYKTPIELCKIGNYQDRIYKNSGKNLFDEVFRQGNRYTNGLSETTRLFTTQNYYVESGKTYTMSTTLNTSTYKWAINLSAIEFPIAPGTSYYYDSGWITASSFTFTPSQSGYLGVVIATSNGSGAITPSDISSYTFMLNEGSTALPYEPYGSGKWYIEKQIGKAILDGSENWKQSSFTNDTIYSVYSERIPNYSSGQVISNLFVWNRYVSTSTTTEYIGTGFGTLRIGVFKTRLSANTITAFKEWLSTHNTTVYYVLATPTTTEITDSELISQLESIELLEGLNNIGISTPYLPFIMTLRYNHQEEHTDSDLIFCGVVKNSGQISLNPRQPHYSTLQILDYKTFLSEGELDTFVISNKTVLEAIQMIIDDISQYGFELGTVSILNENDIIGAYSTKDKSAYDVFNYIADITQSRWTTRVLDKGQVAIDFYDPTLMEQGTAIDYTQTWFKNNNIIDMSFNYGTWDYRNKQVMTSQEVYGSITQNQIINYDGYATQIMTEFPIGQINAIYVNGVGRLFSTNEEKNIGLTADFYYSPGDNFFERNMSIGAGSQIIISYIPIVEGRQIVTNASEISRVATATGVKGIVSRYENRNDATTSDELQKIGQSYIKYKGEPEITLTVKTESNLWEIGQRVQFNAPIEELDTEYMVKKKAINYVVTANKIFYTYELSSSFNSESAINYFDNQRAKANGNIKKGQYVSRNVDLEEEAQIIFYDTTATTTSITGNNVLQSNLETILGG